MQGKPEHLGYLLVERPMPYQRAWEMQNALFEKRRRGDVPHILFLTEHPPVYTFGKSGHQENFLLSESEVRRRGIELFWTDRGGDITFHGPGQLVGYPIFDLHDFYLDVGRFLRELEEGIIRALEVFSIDAGRIPGLTGVWVGEKKIAAIGIKLSRWVTKHGFAINVNTDLGYFKNIVPCGIADKAITSMQEIIGAEVPMPGVIDAVVQSFSQVFDLEFETKQIAELLETVTVWKS